MNMLQRTGARNKRIKIHNQQKPSISRSLTAKKAVALVWLWKTGCFSTIFPACPLAVHIHRKQSAFILFA